eukprot:TRINITY_DN10888_c0_g1_i1.p1 TRINITY_DN10888_c0_g1~~TRINITY_DN10888_c0_g1_i1.p1  ORF type:complete len:179 (-),score=18.78 TRINITY_DN10888_c0_g1_i1:120-656(-)
MRSVIILSLFIISFQRSRMGKIVDVFLLDLDQTLVDVYFCTKDDCDHVILGHKNYMLHKRPHLDNFLNRISVTNYEIIIWTASDEIYAKCVVDFLFQNQTKKPLFVMTANDLPNAPHEKTIAVLHERAKDNNFELRKIIIYDDDEKNFKDFKAQRKKTPAWSKADEEDNHLNEPFEFE